MQHLSFFVSGSLSVGGVLGIAGTRRVFPCTRQDESAAGGGQAVQGRQAASCRRHSLGLLCVLRSGAAGARETWPASLLWALQAPAPAGTPPPRLERGALLALCTPAELTCCAFSLSSALPVGVLGCAPQVLCSWGEGRSQARWPEPNSQWRPHSPAPRQRDRLRLGPVR